MKYFKDSLEELFSFAVIKTFNKIKGKKFKYTVCSMSPFTLSLIHEQYINCRIGPACTIRLVECEVFEANGKTYISLIDPCY